MAMPLLLVRGRHIPSSPPDLWNGSNINENSTLGGYGGCWEELREEKTQQGIGFCATGWMSHVRFLQFFFMYLWFLLCILCFFCISALVGSGFWVFLVGFGFVGFFGKVVRIVMWFWEFFWVGMLLGLVWVSRSFFLFFFFFMG